MKYSLVDLFCGCGGISRGFEWTGRFGSQLGVEIEPHPARAFANNITNVAGEASRIFTGDVGVLSRSSSALWAELKAAGVSRPGEIDVLAGGPPCQGFSRNGVRQYQSTDRSERFYDDPRNHLYKDFLEIVKYTEPKIVLVENVREFLNYNEGKFSTDLLQWFEDLGYDVQYKKIAAAEFGVPQKRHRVFFVAVRKDVSDISGIGPVFPDPSHADEYLFSNSSSRIQTVRDAMGDLPVPVLGKQNLISEYNKSQVTSALSRKLRRKSNFIHNHVARPLSQKQVDRINAVGTGRMKDISSNLQTKSYYGSAYRRLAWDEPSLTITTWVYHVGSGRFAHPDQDRGVTMREAARLQTFDDEYIFPPLINPVSQMIGNAVPPLLASLFADKFVSILDKYYEAEGVTALSVAV